VTIIDAAHARLSTPRSRNDSWFTPPLLGKEVYTTELYQTAIDTDQLISDIEPLVSEVWREFGYGEGTESIEDGKWIGGSVKVGQDLLLDKGDQ
jgi:hypothetical protein